MVQGKYVAISWPEKIGDMERILAEMMGWFGWEARTGTERWS